MEGLFGNVMHVSGEDLEKANEDWTMVHRKNRQSKRKQLVQPSMDEGKSSTKEGSRPLKLKGTPRPPKKSCLQAG